MESKQYSLSCWLIVQTDNTAWLPPSQLATLFSSIFPQHHHHFARLAPLPAIRNVFVILLACFLVLCVVYPHFIIPAPSLTVHPHWTFMPAHNISGRRCVVQQWPAPSKCRTRAIRRHCTLVTWTSALVKTSCARYSRKLDRWKGARLLGNREMIRMPLWSSLTISRHLPHWLRWINGCFSIRKWRWGGLMGFWWLHVVGSAVAASGCCLKTNMWMP